MEKKKKGKENNLKKGFISSFEELTTTENINVICFTLQVFEWYAHHNALRGTKKINIDSGYHGNAGDMCGFGYPGSKMEPGTRKIGTETGTRLFFGSTNIFYSY